MSIENRSKKQRLKLFIFFCLGAYFLYGICNYALIHWLKDEKVELYKLGPWTSAKINRIHREGKGIWLANVDFFRQEGGIIISCRNVAVKIGSMGAGLKEGDVITVAPAHDSCLGAGTAYDSVPRTPFLFFD